MSHPPRFEGLRNVFLLVAALLTGGAATNTANCGTTPTSPTPTSPTPTPGPNTEIFTTADGVRFFVDTVATSLALPWSLAFAPDGRLFFTERPGRVRILQNGVVLPQPALTIADVIANGDSGALGLALHPDFARTH